MIWIRRLFVFCLHIFLLVPLLRGQNDCLKDWAYMRTVNINNIGGSPLTDFQIRVTFDTQSLIAAGKMKADGSDIRFTTGDCCTEMPVWIQNGINTAATRVWTRVPLIAASSVTRINIYYGNPNAAHIEHLDSVMFNIGNDSTGTSTIKTGVVITTQEIVFPISVRTVRFKVYSGDTARFKFKLANDTNMVVGTSPFFNAPSTPGFHTYDWEGQVVAGGYPGFFTTDSLRIMNRCSPVTPCPGSCGDLTFGIGDLVVFGALDSTTCGAYPSLRVWYRRSAFIDPFISFNGAEFSRRPTFSTSYVGDNILCPGDTGRITATGLAGAFYYQWYDNGVPIAGAVDTALTIDTAGIYYCLANFGQCKDVFSDSTTIRVSRANINFGDDRSICTDTGATLSSQPGFIDYLWNTGDTTAVIQLSATGSYWLQVTDTAGCVGRDTVEVVLHPLPDPVIMTSGRLTFCPGDSVYLEAFDPRWFTYLWNVGNVTSASLLVTQPGSYQVEVIDRYGCKDTSTSVVVQNWALPVLDLGPDVAFCAGDSAVFDVGSQWASIVWAWGFTGQSYTATFSGSFLVEVTDTNGCKTRDTVRAQVYALPRVSIGRGGTICPDATWNISATTGFASYLWSNGATTPSIQAPPGNYSVTITDGNGCRDGSDTVTVDTFPAISSPVIVEGADGFFALPAPNYQWIKDGLTIPGATGQTYTATETGTYSVSVIDPNGCDTLYSNFLSALFIRDISQDQIPEGFSPNGDGINDFFEVANLAFFPGNSLRIVNRWGQDVYYKAPYDNSFGGQSDQGIALPDATYFYILDLGNGKAPFSGYLIINR
jgi:gliding motility-associated-like protein